MEAIRRIGIFGGSFNPVHLGHILAARAAKKTLKLDEIIFVPCFRSADGKKLMPSRLRFRMLRDALRNIPGFSVSDIELRRGGISRSIDTVLYFKNHGVQNKKLFLIIGEDQAAQFSSWKDAVSISRLSKVCVMGRASFRKIGLIHKKYHFRAVKIPQYEISSTCVRARMAKNLPIFPLLPHKNLSFLKEFRNSI